MVLSNLGLCEINMIRVIHNTRWLKKRLQIDEACQEKAYTIGKRVD